MPWAAVPFQASSTPSLKPEGSPVLPSTSLTASSLNDTCTSRLEASANQTPLHHSGLLEISSPPSSPWPFLCFILLHFDTSDVTQTH